MKATHTMKVNGIIYRAGEEIPSPDEKPVKQVEKPVEKVEPPVEKAEEPIAEGKYTKKDITFMKVSKLRELAEIEGVENPDELTGVELKKILIDKMGL